MIIIIGRMDEVETQRKLDSIPKYMHILSPSIDDNIHTKANGL